MIHATTSRYPIRLCMIIHNKRKFKGIYDEIRQNKKEGTNTPVFGNKIQAECNNETRDFKM